MSIGSNLTFVLAAGSPRGEPVGVVSAGAERSHQNENPAALTILSKICCDCAEASHAARTARSKYLVTNAEIIYGCTPMQWRTSLLLTL